jgi:hypothetical protein
VVQSHWQRVLHAHDAVGAGRDISTRRARVSRESWPRLQHGMLLLQMPLCHYTPAYGAPWPPLWPLLATAGHCIVTTSGCCWPLILHCVLATFGHSLLNCHSLLVCSSVFFLDCARSFAAIHICVDVRHAATGEQVSADTVPRQGNTLRWYCRQPRHGRRLVVQPPANDESQFGRLQRTGGKPCHWVRCECVCVCILSRWICAVS